MVFNGRLLCREWMKRILRYVVSSFWAAWDVWVITVDSFRHAGDIGG